MSAAGRREIVVRLDGAGRRFGQGHTAVVALHPTDLAVG